MKYFFLLIFFSKTTLLVPKPITLTEEWITITPEKSFRAIARGSEIRIRLTDNTNQLRKLRKAEKEQRSPSQMAKKEKWGLFPPSGDTSPLTEDKVTGEHRGKSRSEGDLRGARLPKDRKEQIKNIADWGRARAALSMAVSKTR